MAGPRASLILLMVAFSAAAYSTPAHACRGWQFSNPLFHDDLRDAPENTVAAEVVIVKSNAGVAMEPELEARVIKVLQGRIVAERVKISQVIISSCDDFPAVGESGILVGYLRSDSVDEAIIEPVRALSAYRRGLD